MKKLLNFWILIVISTLVLRSQYTNEVPALSPPVDSVAGLETWMNYLPGEWRFTPEAGADGHLWPMERIVPFEMFPVPSEWQMAGKKVPRGDTAGYYKNLDIPDTWEGRTVKLRFDGVYSHALVYVNGTEVGEIRHPFTPYEFDITGAVICGERNLLYLRVTASSLGDSLSNASYFSFHNMGGINRTVKAYPLPDCHYKSLHVRTRFDSLYDDAWMIVDYTITNSGKVRKQVAVDINMADTAGNLVYLGKGIDRLFKLNAGQTKSFSDSFRVESPVKWDPEHPVLYELRTRLFDGGDWLLWSSRKFGFRQIEVRGNQVFVNNHPIKLRGVNWIDVEPYSGRVVRWSTMMRDLLMFRQANINYIRTVGCPPTEEFLNLCDAMGFFVEVEAPLSRAHASLADGPSEYLLPPSKRYEAITEPTLRMVHNSMSHPSVLMWSLGNESKFYQEYFRETAQAVKKLDPFRPLVFSQFTPEADMHELEIGNHHFPGPGGPALYRNSSRPIVFDAFSHIYTYNHRELFTDPGLRDLWGEVTTSMWEDMYRAEGVLGGALWAGLDDIHILFGQPYGSGPCGILDAWRRTKPEFWHVMQMYSPVRITKSSDQKWNGKKLILTLENRHDFTNLKECGIQWKCNEAGGELSVDIPPRSSGQLTLELPEISGPDTLEISVTDPRGVRIQYARIPLGEPKTIGNKKGKTRLPPVRYEDKEQELHIGTAGFSFVLDKGSGLFNVLDREDTLVVHSPRLMVLPLSQGSAEPLRGHKELDALTQTASEWEPASVVIEHMKKKACRVKVSGKYREASGSFIYEIWSDGTIAVSYDFILAESLSPRQSGLVFELNGKLSTLSWDREGFWSYYPPDHIGRSSGEARTDTLIPVSWISGPVDPPKNGWELDRNALGSNDFRATRTRVHRAELRDPDGSSIGVISDGMQSIRAWKQDGTIRLLVADFSGEGTNPINPVSGSIAPVIWNQGKRIGGTVRIKPVNPNR